MKTTFVSTLAVQNAMRLTISRAQSDIQTLQKEVVTGRHADVGTALGAEASRSVALNREVARLQTIRDTNSIVTQRLSASQQSLGMMSDSAQGMLQAFISANGAEDQARLTVANQEVTNAYDAFDAAINTSFNGEYLFSGVNSDVKPLNDYLDPAGSVAKASFDAAFLGYFGFTQTNPATVTITGAQMDDFLDNVLEPIVAGPAWNTDWSGAADTNISSRISRNEVVESSTNANIDGVRSFALASMVGLELYGAQLSNEARKSVNAHAIEYAGQAVTGIDAERTRLGVSEARVTKANTSLEAQTDIVKLYLGDLEGVDAYEASTRMNALLAQVETSYSLTSRIQRLSLVDYL